MYNSWGKYPGPSYRYWLLRVWHRIAAGFSGIYLLPPLEYVSFRLGHVVHQMDAAVEEDDDSSSVSSLSPASRALAIADRNADEEDRANTSEGK